MTASTKTATCYLGVMLAVWLSVTAAPAQSTDEALALPPNPTVEAILASPRKTPVDTARVLFVLVDLREAARAQPILAELIERNLDNQGQAALVREFGSAKFLRLATTSGLGPEAAEFAQQCLASAAELATDPQRLSVLVDQLGAKFSQKRYAALADLKATGETGAMFCLNAIAKAADAQKQNQLREALVELAPLSTPLLLGALQSDNKALKTQAAFALGKIGTQPAAAPLATLAVFEPVDSTANQAATWAYEQITGQPFSFANFDRLLSREIKRYTTGGFPFTPNASGEIAIGHIRSVSGDSASGQVTLIRLPAKDAALKFAAQLAEARVRVAPDRRDLMRDALVLRLQADAVLRRAGVAASDDQQWFDLADTSQLNQSLALALKKQYNGAAIALCDVIAERRDISALYAVGGKASPLADALRSPHQGVRFAALAAAMQLNSPAPFPGSSRVAESLVYFASSDGRKAAVVVTPQRERSATIGGFLSAADYQVQVTNRGREAIKLAAERPDLHCVLVDMGILDPHVRETLFRLRRQPSTAGVPIGLLAADGRLAEAHRIAAEHDCVHAFARPHSSAAVIDIAESLEKFIPADWPSPADRAAHAKQSVQWITKLLAEGPTFYGLRDHVAQLQLAITHSADPAMAIQGLTLLGTAASQRELLGYVGRETLPIDVRQQAAEAFGKSVENHGMLLTTNQIVAQYDRYNASESASEETQQVLGAVLDTIENQATDRIRAQ